MTGANGHAQTGLGPTAHSPFVTADIDVDRESQARNYEKVRALVADLEVPFETSVIEWRVTNTSHEGKRGQVVPYADPRAYTDRLNALFTPAGWTRKYTVNTSANFERAKDKKIVAKVLVTCELTIFGVGAHSATGEEWADNEYACTAAEAQAFKRSCACFGLGRYLYYFSGVWVDLDERKRPTKLPTLFNWATPEGWRTGERPPKAIETDLHSGQKRQATTKLQGPTVIAEIEAMAGPLGRGLYRGLLRDLARVWNPQDIQESSLQQKVLEHMRAAERGLHRLETALNEVGTERLIPILKSLGFKSLERVDSLETLRKIVSKVEHLPHAS